MRLVVDANIIISALIRDSVIRGILTRGSFEFLAPDFIIEEIYKHEKYICEKSGLAKEDFELLLSFIIENIRIMPKKEYEKFFEEAGQLIKDLDDVPFVAVALASQVDGIWSDDQHFLAQNKISIFKTKDMINLM